MSNKVTIKVEKFEDVQLGDLACGFPVDTVGKTFIELDFGGSSHYYNIPAPIIQALCASGHVTREVDAEDAVEWFEHNDTHWSARFCGDVIGVVAKDGRFYFKVYDPRFTGVIEAKFLELTGGAK